MYMIVAKFAVSAIVITIVSEVAKRYERVGAFMASLPLVTLMVMMWLFAEGAGTEKISQHSYYTFWYVLPTLPMFLLVPWLLNRGWQFIPTLVLGVLCTILCFYLIGRLARFWNVHLF